MSPTDRTPTRASSADGSVRVRAGSRVHGRDRGVSTALGYVLVLGILTVLVSGLLVAGAGFVEDQRERVIRAELEVIGQQVASGVETTDRLADAGGSGTTASVRVQLPERVADVGYTVEFVPDGSHAAVRLTVDDGAVTETVGFVTTRAVVTGDAVRGGTVEVYVTDTGDLALREVDP